MRAWLRGRLLRVAVRVHDAGMSTAEYAVGMIAAVGFAALLFKVLTSPDVRKMLTELIKRALNVAG